MQGVEQRRVSEFVTEGTNEGIDGTRVHPQAGVGEGEEREGREKGMDGERERGRFRHPPERGEGGPERGGDLFCNIRQMRWDQTYT